MLWSDAPLIGVRVCDQPLRREGQLEPRRVQQREVVQAGVASGTLGVGLLDKHEQVLAPGAEHRLAVAAAVRAQPDRPS